MDNAHTPERSPGRRRAKILIGLGVVILVAAGAAVAVRETTPRSAVTRLTVAATTSTSAPTVTGSTITTAPVLQPPGPGFIPGHVTAVGDSIMLDYQDPLEADIPGIEVDAAVSRQWSDGEALLESIKGEGQLGADVIVGLGTNGPITDSDFDSMMAILGGASRVVFVNVHVDRPWQDPNNVLIANDAKRYPNAVVADWETLAGQNPQWFGPDATHLPIDGPGADALASLVTSTLVDG